MSPQLYVTVYEEQFASPGPVRREQLRPTSAHRRNNPQPRPDFLFPRSLRSKQHRTVSHPPPPPSVASGRPLFPPVRPLSLRSAGATYPPDHRPKALSAGRAIHMPPVSATMRQALPSAGELQKLRPIQLPFSTGFGIQPGPQGPARQHTLARLPPRPRTSNPVAALHVPPLPQRRGSAPKIRLDYSGGHSCFHVVKPYHAAHYVIHPQFVSECLR